MRLQNPLLPGRCRSRVGREHLWRTLPEVADVANPPFVHVPTSHGAQASECPPNANDAIGRLEEWYLVDRKFRQPLTSVDRKRATHKSAGSCCDRAATLSGCLSDRARFKARGIRTEGARGSKLRRDTGKRTNGGCESSQIAANHRNGCRKTIYIPLIYDSNSCIRQGLRHR